MDESCWHLHVLIIAPGVMPVYRRRTLNTPGDAKCLPAYRAKSSPSRSLTASFKFCREPR
jgi:hypothetical protein